MLRSTLIIIILALQFSISTEAQTVDAVELEEGEETLELAEDPEVENFEEAPATIPATQKQNNSEEIVFDSSENNLPEENTSFKGATPESFGSTGGSVILETPEDFSLNYKTRRTTHGLSFSVFSENFYPIDYQSQFADGYIENIIGDGTIQLTGIEMGYKYNISLGSISALYSYSQGAIAGTTDGYELSLTRHAISANVTLDAVFDEPYVAPYFQAGMHQFYVDEVRPAESISATASMAFNFRYGLLFQLDWLESTIDKGAKIERLQSSGLENTYIDIYFANHMASSSAQDPLVLGSEGDPNLSSSDEMGIGLKLEF